LDSTYIKAYLRRAKSYMELEKFEEAVRDYEYINRVDRGNFEYRQLLSHAKQELKKSKRKDYYKILGVDRNANEDEVKKAYKRSALTHHPGTS
jgi:DnaJ family protein C protein 7